MGQWSLRNDRSKVQDVKKIADHFKRRNIIRFITMLCGIDNIPRNILIYQTECGKYLKILCGTS